MQTLGSVSMSRLRQGSDDALPLLIMQPLMMGGRSYCKLAYSIRRGYGLGCLLWRSSLGITYLVFASNENGFLCPAIRPKTIFVHPEWIGAATIILLAVVCTHAIKASFHSCSMVCVWKHSLMGSSRSTCPSVSSRNMMSLRIQSGSWALSFLRTLRTVESSSLEKVCRAACGEGYSCCNFFNSLTSVSCKRGPLCVVQVSRKSFVCFGSWRQLCNFFEAIFHY